MGLGRRAGSQLVSDQLAQLLKRGTVVRRSQIRLVGEPLGVEGEDVGDHCPRVQKGDGEVVFVAGGQRGQLWPVGVGECGNQRRVEVTVRPNPVGDLAETGTVEDASRRAIVCSLAAAACPVDRHLPPSMVSVSAPRSGKFGSLSSRAISRRPMVSTPVSVASVLESR